MLLSYDVAYCADLGVKTYFFFIYADKSEYYYYYLCLT